METKKLFFVFWIGFLLSTRLFAQTDVLNNYDVSVYLTKTDTAGIVDTVYTLNSGIEKIRITPIGNYLRVVTFDLDRNHLMMQKLLNSSKPIWVFRLTMTADIDGDGFDDIIVDEMAALTRGGKLKFVYHSNGAGSNLPPGWIF